MWSLLNTFAYIFYRAIYLRRSLAGRFVFHILLLIVWHVWLFFLLPADFLTGRYVHVHELSWPGRNSL